MCSTKKLPTGIPAGYFNSFGTGRQMDCHRRFETALTVPHLQKSGQRVERH